MINKQIETIIAVIPAQTIKKNGKTWSFPEKKYEFKKDENGTWRGVMGAILEEDVIDICKKASNWDEIKAKHFQMFGFQN